MRLLKGKLLTKLLFIFCMYRFVFLTFRSIVRYVLENIFVVYKKATEIKTCYSKEMSNFTEVKKQWNT